MQSYIASKALEVTHTGSSINDTSYSVFPFL
jgi:hypothetical protein